MTPPRSPRPAALTPPSHPPASPHRPTLRVDCDRGVARLSLDHLGLWGIVVFVGVLACAVVCDAVLGVVR